MILTIPFLHTTMKEMVERLDNLIEKQQKTFVVTANPEIVLAAYEDERYKKVVAKADYIVADGIGVVKAAQLLGTPLPERVAGFDLFLALLQKANEKHLRVYLLGGKPEVLERVKVEINKSYPNVQIVGAHHGFFDWHDQTIEAEIQAQKPDMVFAALGFPRQEKWIAEKFDLFEKGMFMGIGGSFDVLAGEVKRAPEIWQKLNIEWLYRLVKQPTRWKRMLALPRFALIILKEKVTKTK